MLWVKLVLIGYIACAVACGVSEEKGADEPAGDAGSMNDTTRSDTASFDVTQQEPDTRLPVVDVIEGDTPSPDQSLDVPVEGDTEEMEDTGSDVDEEPEGPERDCHNHTDDDSDGFYDCDDSDCSLDPVCSVRLVCDTSLDRDCDGIADVQDNCPLLEGRLVATGPLMEINERDFNQHDLRFGQTADLDDDGELDFVLGLGGHVHFWFGQGDGLFAKADSESRPWSSSGVGVGDFNSDGFPDVFVRGRSGTDSMVLFGDGMGVFVEGPPVPLRGGGDGMCQVLIEDLNSDGHSDVITGCDGVLEWEVLVGRGDGVFVPGALLQSLSSPNRAFIEDIDDDGEFDLVVFGRPSNVVFRGIGEGRFEASEEVAIDVVSQAVVKGDFAEDGKQDFLVSTRFGRQDEGSYWWMLLETIGGELVATDLGLNSFGLAASTGDFNGDGHLDVLARHQEGLGGVVFGDGQGGFRAQQGTWPIASIIVGTEDLDGDGRDDLVMGDRLHGGVLAFLWSDADADQADSDLDGIGDLCDHESCADGIDNDGDQRVDCADPDCAASQCGQSRCMPRFDRDCDGINDNRDNCPSSQGGFVLWEGESLFLWGVQTLDAPAARAMGQWQGKHLSFQNLKRLDAASAEGLAMYAGEHILLDGLSSLDPDVATALGQAKAGRLSLNGLKTLDAHTARALLKNGGSEVQLNGIVNLEVGAVQVLVELGVPEMAFPRVKTLNADTAKAMARFRGDAIILREVSSIDAATAQAIGQWKVKKAIFGLEVLDAETAKGLAAFRGQVLELRGLSKVSAEVAKILGQSKARGRLSLDFLDDLSADQTQGLFAFRGAILSLNSIDALSAKIVQPMLKPRSMLISLRGVRHIDDEALKLLERFKGGYLAFNRGLFLGPKARLHRRLIKKPPKQADPIGARAFLGGGPMGVGASMRVDWGSNHASSDHIEAVIKSNPALGPLLGEYSGQAVVFCEKFKSYKRHQETERERRELDRRMSLPDRVSEPGEGGGGLGFGGSR